MSYFKLYESKRNKNKHLNVGELWHWIGAVTAKEIQYNTVYITEIDDYSVKYKYKGPHLRSTFMLTVSDFLELATPLCQKVDCHTT